MKYGSIEDYIATLSEEERELHKDIIENTQKTDKDIKTYRAQSEEELKKLEKARTKFNRKIRDLPTSIGLIKEDIEFYLMLSSKNQYTGKLH